MHTEDEAPNPPADIKSPLQIMVDAAAQYVIKQNTVDSLEAEVAAIMEEIDLAKTDEARAKQDFESSLAAYDLSRGVS